MNAPAFGFNLRHSAATRCRLTCLSSLDRPHRVRDFPTLPFYSGNPWFLPAIGSWYRMRDWLDRRLA